MKRKCFLLVSVFVLALSTWATSSNRVAHADEILIIHGNDDPDCSDGYCDSKTLQDALDAANPGAMLYLKGTFDFGNDQFVSLRKDITIKGERGHNGEYLAVIKGGMNTFALGWDPALGFTEFDGCEFIANPNTQRWPASFTITDLRFEEPTWSAIMGAATTGATISSNQFIGGKQKNTGCNAYGIVEDPDGEMSAISFFSNEYTDARRQVIGVPSDNTGEILIKNNYFNGAVRIDPNGFDPIHGGSSLVHGEPVRMNGMLLPLRVDGTEAQITILNNTFENIMWGLQFWDNSGGLSIKNNSILMNPVDDLGNPIGAVWAGIDIQNVSRSSRAPVQVIDNFIYSKVPDFVYGLLLQSKNATVKNNLLVLEQSQESLWITYGHSAGIFIANESFDNLVIDNTIQGSGQIAIFVEGLTEDWAAEDNIIKNNDVRDFTPLEATDFWCRIFVGEGCPTYPGAHYKFTLFTSDNTVFDEKWMEGMILIDETSDFNPHDPSTYNGNNNIKLDSE